MRNRHRMTKNGGKRLRSAHPADSNGQEETGKHTETKGGTEAGDRNRERQRKQREWLRKKTTPKEGKS